MSSKNLTIAIIFSVFILLGLFVYQYTKFNDGKFHVVFCDVGQGDAIFLRTPSGADILVDGGSNNDVLSCLASNMPFWDRDLELVILTHPHVDHLYGLIGVVRRYKIETFAAENLKNDTAAFKTLMHELKKQNIKVQYLYAGDRFVFGDGVVADIVGPSRSFIEKTSPTGVIGEKSEFANIESLFKYKEFSILLTGDSQATEIKDAIFEGRLNDVDVLQVPHHGSKTGLDTHILEVLKPKLVVISVGKNNKYGHPTEEIIKILSERGTNILRTDEVGEILIITGGVGWKVKN